MPLYQQLNWPRRVVSLHSGQLIRLEFSNTAHVEKMERIETKAYSGKLMWSAIDFYEDMVYNPDTFYIQALDEQGLIGFIGCRRDEQDVHISNFVVCESYQSQGLGHQLLAQVEAIIPDLHRNRITLEVRESNQRAQHFYQREGFTIRRVVQRYYHNGENAVYMTLKVMGSK